MQYVWLNNRLLAAEDAHVSVQDRGFRYGDGVFDTIPVYYGVPYRFDWHMARLEAGLQAVHIDYDTAALQDNVRQLLHKNHVAQGILRLQLTRGVGGRGYLPDPHARPTLVIETFSLPALPTEPVTLWRSRYAKISPQALPVQYKLCQGLNSTLARMEAVEHGCFEALLLSERGELCETSSANLFWLKDNALYTPALSCGVLEGAMRDAVLRLSPLPVQEKATSIEALTQADSVFITNAVWKMLPVRQLLPGNARWEIHPAIERIKNLIDQDIASHCRSQLSRW